MQIKLTSILDSQTRFETEAQGNPKMTNSSRRRSGWRIYMLIKIHRILIKNTLSNIKLIGKILVDFIINLFQSPGPGYRVRKFVQ